MESSQMYNTVNTNAGALIGQKYLRNNAAEMIEVQNRVSSGLRVSSVVDDASTFAVAASMRGDIKGYTAIAASLQGGKVGATVAVQAGETIAKRLEDVKAKIIQLADESISASSRTTYQNDLDSMVDEVNSYLDQATYNGINLFASGSPGSAGIKVIANVDGATITIRRQPVADLADASLSAITGADAASAALAALNSFKSTLDQALANLGADIKRVNAQTEFVRQTEETVRIGLGNLVDADLAKETAAIQSLQVRQQLGVQAMGIANQTPQTLLNLLRG